METCCAYVPEITPYLTNGNASLDVLTGLTIKVSPDGCVISTNQRDQSSLYLDEIYLVSFRHEVQKEILFSKVMRLKKIIPCPTGQIELLFYPERITKQRIQFNCFGKLLYPLEKHDTSFDLEYVYVKADDEYEEVLKLRHLAYSLAGKTAKGATYLDMADRFDKEAVIIAAKWRGEIVGTVRMMLPNTNEVTDHGRYVEYPKNFPPITQVAEGSRLCVAPQFNGRGITYGLATCMVISALVNGRKTYFSGATGTLLDFYQKCGWQLTGVEYQNTALAGLTHELMLLDIWVVP
jgi:predicted GNAT family N-acyltransferase